MYITDFWNLLDILSITNSIVLIFNHVYDLLYQEPKIGDETLTVLAAMWSIFVWMKMFYWLNLFRRTSFYIVLIHQTIIDIRWFLVIFFGLLTMLGSALYLVNKSNADD